MDQLVKQNLQTVFSYLFGVITKYEYRSIIGDKDLAKEIWHSVASNGYILKNCKLFVYANLVAKESGQVVSPARFGIERADVAPLRRLDLKSVNKGHKAYSVFDFTNLETAILTSPEMSTYIGKFISKKLIFLCRSYGLKRDEIQADLLCAALYALRKQYPFYETELHALNICKTAISNAGQGLIEFWTRDKRNALLKENGGFQAVHVQYEVMQDLSVMPEHEDELRLNIQSLSSIAARLPTNQQEWVNTASGKHDRGFSFYIGRNNSDAVEVLPYNRYIDLLCKYHRVERDAMIAILRKAIS
jgi:hypothetical protein